MRSQTAITDPSDPCDGFWVSYCLSDYLYSQHRISCVIAKIFASVVLPVIYVNKRLAGFPRNLRSNNSFGHDTACSSYYLQVVFSLLANQLRLGHIGNAAALCAVYYINWRSLGATCKEE